MQQDADYLRGQLLKMQQRAETSEAQLQQIMASSSQSALAAAAAPFSPQRALQPLPSAAPFGAPDAVSAAESSNLLQLSQLTAQVVLDCRRMTEVNQSQLREVQVNCARASDQVEFKLFVKHVSLLPGTRATSSHTT